MKKAESLSFFSTLSRMRAKLGKERERVQSHLDICSIRPEGARHLLNAHLAEDGSVWHNYACDGWHKLKRSSKDPFSAYVIEQRLEEPHHVTPYKTEQETTITELRLSNGEVVVFIQHSNTSIEEEWCWHVPKARDRDFSTRDYWSQRMERCENSINLILTLLKQRNEVEEWMRHRAKSLDRNVHCLNTTWSDLLKALAPDQKATRLQGFVEAADSLCLDLTTFAHAPCV